MKRLVLILAFVSMFAQEAAQETIHVVKPGDCLWDIAGFYYQNPFLWPYIWRANLTKIEDPHWIYPDQEFIIPPSPEATGEVPPPTTEYVPPTTEYVPPTAEYVPPPEKRAAELISVVKAEERVFSEEFIHRAGFIVSEALPYWGQILNTEPAGEKNITTFSKVYIDRAEGVKVGDVLTIYRPGIGLEHPATGKGLGQEIIVLGKLEVEEVGEQGSRCKVIASYDIIKNGDLLTPYEPILAPENVELVQTTKEVEGYVVEVKNQGMVTPPHTFVYIDQGEESGVAVGDLYEIYQERVVGDRKQPNFVIGKVQVLSIFENASISLLTWYRETTVVKRGEKIRLAMEAR